MLQIRTGRKATHKAGRVAFIPDPPVIGRLVPKNRHGTPAPWAKEIANDQLWVQSVFVFHHMPLSRWQRNTRLLANMVLMGFLVVMSWQLGRWIKAGMPSTF